MNQTLWHSRRSWFSLNTILFTRIILIALLIPLARYAGIAVASGKIRTVLLLIVPLPILLVERLNERARFWLLIAAILCVPLQVRGLPSPYGLSPMELMLLLLVVVQLALKRQGWTALMNTQCVPYIIFAFAGLIAAVSNGDLNVWHTVCLVPLLLTILTNSMVHTPDDAVRLVRAALIAILGYLLIFWLANQIGIAIRGRGPEQYREGTQHIILGPIEYVSWTITFGTLIALGVPTVIILLLQVGKSNLSRFFYGAILVLFAALIVLTAARGAAVAALVGTLVALVVSRRTPSPGMVATIVVLILAALIWREFLSNILPYQNLERLYTLRYVGSLGNFRSRMDTLRFTIENIFQNPLGYGAGYLYHRYGIDESIMYSMLLNSAGLMGFVGFALVVGQLLWHFAMRIPGALVGAQRDLAAIGLGTLVCGLLAGLACESVLFAPVHSFVFWAILTAAYRGMRVPWPPAPNLGSEYQCESLNGSVP